MAKPTTILILAQLRDARSYTEQISVLKALKNNLVGHQDRKEVLLQSSSTGCIEQIVRILATAKSQGHQNGKNKHDPGLRTRRLGDEEEVRLQALCVIGSLAHGGPAFLAPLHTSAALPVILSNIDVAANPPQVVLAALRSLGNLVTSISLSPSSQLLNANILADHIFSRPHINSLCGILQQPTINQIIMSQEYLAVSLITRLCRDERHQLSLANAGILDTLSSKLAGIVASQGLIIPGADLLAQKEGTLGLFPAADLGVSHLACVLEGISVIIANSKFRASQLVYSDALTTVFPVSCSMEFQPSKSTKAAWGPFTSAEVNNKQSQLSAIDYLLPQLPPPQARIFSALSSAFPPLGTSGSFDSIGHVGQSKNTIWQQATSFEARDNQDAGEPESPLIAYLIWLTRSSRGLERLMAASVLTDLYRTGLTNKSRETALGLFIVPLLVQLLDEGNADIPKDSDPLIAADILASRWILQERTPAVLAMLIVDSEYLQKTAYDSGVINKLSKMIKVAYDPVIESSDCTAWSPNASADPNLASSTQTSNLGCQSLPPVLIHKIKVRESTLQAIAALVPFKDEYRKALIDQGIVPYVVESLKPSPDKPSAKVAEKTEKASSTFRDSKIISPGFGTNPVSVLIAACGAIRHLSRSVSILRTTLIDNGVVMPVFSLLQHSDIEVQIAATAAVCNLVTDFSPMRETISAAGVLKVLCEHAHSGNVKLRLNALWALKHLVQSADNDVKKMCLEELGQGWLVQLICDDTEDAALFSARSKSGSYGADDDMGEDFLMDRFEDEEDSMMSDSVGGSGTNSVFYDTRQAISRPSSSRGGLSALTNSRLAALRDLETNPARRARKDDIAVQEQGLQFIRNLIGAVSTVGSTETSDMIDFLFNALGQDQIFEILLAKLRPKILNPFGRRNGGSSSEARVVPPQPEIIAAVVYILVHMAASVPRHRQLLISQHELLRHLVPQFTHPNKEVRAALCWLVINLTCMDDSPDQPACANRAHELKKLGFLAKLEHLEQDYDLDVRERAKTAVYQIKQYVY